MANPKWLKELLLDALPVKVRRQYLFKKDHGKRANLEHPQDFSEKIVWRMLNDHRDVLKWTCDKEAMKREVVARDSTVNAVPTLWYGTNVAEISQVKLPEKWVLKPNRQSSGRVYFGEGEPDLASLAPMVRKWLRGEGWKIQRKGEWAYGQAKSGLLVEPRLKGPGEGEPPVDYKIFVFGGVPELIQVHYGRGGNHVQYHMTPEWDDYGISTIYTTSGVLPPKPKSLDLMLRQAVNISREFDFMRVDFYEEDGKPFFGEVTPYPAGARRVYNPISIERKLGDLWKLPLS